MKLKAQKKTTVEVEILKEDLLLEMKKRNFNRGDVNSVLGKLENGDYLASFLEIPESKSGGVILIDVDGYYFKIRAGEISE